MPVCAYYIGQQPRGVNWLTALRRLWRKKECCEQEKIGRIAKRVSEQGDLDF
jgi:hypothetical protein